MLTRSRATPLRRLPGLRFEVQTEPLVDVLPRMDVAALVGFASSGPLHTPVVVEDVAQFTGIFGADAPLAWDKTRGEMVYANLAPAVRAFFRNGGQRCWVVRVAGSGAADQPFPHPRPGLPCSRRDRAHLSGSGPGPLRRQLVGRPAGQHGPAQRPGCPNPSIPGRPDL